MKHRVVRLGQVTDINPSTKATGSAEDLVSFLAMADISEEGRVASVQQRPLADVQKGYTVFQAGDVLLAKITPCFENGKAALVESLPTKVGFGSTEFHVLRPTKEINRKFLFHLLWNPNFRRLGTSRMTGSAGQKRVPAAFLADYEFSLPSLEEQQRIATILDKADSLRRKRQEAIRLADEFMRAAYVELLGDPTENPYRWPSLELGEIVESTKLGLVRSSEDFGWNLPTPYLRMDAITNNGKILHGKIQGTTATPAEIDDFCLKRGDLLFNTRNSRELVGKTALWDGSEGVVFNNNIMRIRFIDSMVPEVVAMQFQLPKLKRELEYRKSGTTSVFAIYYKDLRSLPIQVPSQAMQAKFARIAQQTRLYLAKVDVMAREAEALSFSLRHQLFSGI